MHRLVRLMKICHLCFFPKRKRTERERAKKDMLRNGGGLFLSSFIVFILFY